MLTKKHVDKENKLTTRNGTVHTSNMDITTREGIMADVKRAEIESQLSKAKLPALPEPLPALVTDNHTHADATVEFSGLDPELNLSAAAVVGVHRIVEVGCDQPSSEWAVDFAATHEQVVAAVALHPNDGARMVARQGPEAVNDVMRRIEQLATAHERVRAVGETGLDYFRIQDPAGQAFQRELFARHIEIAQRTGRALVIHDRDAHADVAAVLDEYGWPPRTILHCFSGDAEFAATCLEHDAWLSFAGSVTFKANGAVRDALRSTPADKVLVETDAPYLTPVPMRGRPNAPYLVPHTVRFLAAARGIETSDEQALAAWCRQLDANTSRAYGSNPQAIVTGTW
ncbi:Hydrolase, TatD family [Propionibacterium freudenreichii]|nr:TatD family hydrolase [Propionibacterium freudenreichii]CEG92977.1 DNase [Propionibacterium freudenreichii]SBN59462.1 Hydrolase, TatD family [Propionibacterium freudenreichii]SBN94919.1 Hydrolase, TatD family [Propionibacterium freudenreichii]SBT28672.1 Hydrolase, TatD family [Propionibacterium freudenreichii]SCC96503.1 Hydrolase, TatD family [Propionibacterium freudenreichii]